MARHLSNGDKENNQGDFTGDERIHHGAERNDRDNQAHIN